MSSKQVTQEPPAEAKSDSTKDTNLSSSDEKTTSNKELVPSKEELTPEEKYTLWGLGRGVDITKPTPWLNKTSFQVRKVFTADLIETDEGGLVKQYTDVVSSSTTIHSQVSSGLKAPDIPLTIGVDAEYSHTECSSKHVVGKKIKNRTIAFRVDFDDVPESRVDTLEKAKEQMKKTNVSGKKTLVEKRRHEREAKEQMKKTKDSTQVSVSGKETLFETRLCKWLKKCLGNWGICLDESPDEELCLACIKDKGSLIEDDEQTGELEEDINSFIKHFGVTHYVSAIELGALQFSVLTENQYEKKLAASGSSSFSSLFGGAEASASLSKSSATKMSHSERKEIGKIKKDGDNGDTEKVEECDEAVIGCEIRPISSLVKNPYLQQAIKSSVKKYTKEKISSESHLYM